jgi:hypothetical protein
VTQLADALRKKFSSPKEALAALGLDENLLADDTERLKAARRARSHGRVQLATDGAKEKAMTKPTRFAYHALQMVVPAITPLLAKDAKINLMPVFKDLTTQNFRAKKVKLALDAALKGKLAQDAEPTMGHVAALLDHIEHTVGEPKTLDESVSEAQHGAMGAAAGGKSNLGIPKETGEEFMKADKGKFDSAALGSYLQDHGLDEEAIKGAMDLLPHIEEEKEEGEGRDAEPGEGVGEKDWAEDDEFEPDLTGKGSKPGGKDQGQEPVWEEKNPAKDAEESEGTRKSDLKEEEKGARKHEDEREAGDKFPRRTTGKDKKRADDKRADDKRADDSRRADDKARGKDKFPHHALDSDMVTKQAMDAAIEAATKATVDRMRGIDKAKAAVRPYVGHLLAFDSAQSADDIYAATLKARDIPIKGIDPSAFPTILGLLPRAGAKEVVRGTPAMAMDEEQRDKLHEMFPGIARIQNA